MYQFIKLNASDLLTAMINLIAGQVHASNQGNLFSFALEVIAIRSSLETPSPEALYT